MRNRPKGLESRSDAPNRLLIDFPLSGRDLVNNPLTTGELKAPALECWKRHKVAGELPTSTHFLYYELEGLGFISKEQRVRTDGKRGRRPDQNLTEAITQLSESGQIPWEDIVDGTRDLNDFTGHPRVLDGVL
jgi:hypothetical protein